MRKRHLRFFPLPVAILVAAFVPAAQAQTGSLTTILASPAGPEISVDGTVYFTAASAFWPVGSSHTLSVPQGVGFSYNRTFDTQWQFQQWEWNGGASASPTIQVIGNLGITKYTAVFSTEYLFTTAVACNPAPCNGVPGVILVNGVPAPNAGTWETSGAGQSLTENTNPGYIFSGWQVGNSIVSTLQPYAAVMSGPLNVTAVFVPAKAVTLATNPPNLTFYADGILMITPSTMPWGLNTSHLISGLNVTNDDTGKRWVFASWSDGGARTHPYVVGTTLKPETITCNYAAAAYPIFITSPPNLNLVVDSLVLPPPYSYIWGVGSTHMITASSPQTDSHGTTWVFQSWDDGVTTPTRTFTIPAGADTNGFRMTALYTQKAQLTVNSTIPGQVVTVNGSTCTTPCSLNMDAGQSLHVSAPASIPVNTTSRQDLLGWSLGGATPVAGDWSGTLTTANATLTATYHQMNSLTVNATPSRAATWRFTPSSPDGFYDAQTTVHVRVAARPGYRFSGWSGDLSGNEPAGALAMNVPRRALALLVTAHTGARPGVTNGAGLASVSGVAPGSVASIFGEHLAAENTVGPASPLAKALGGVTVRIGTRTLPLYFASPTQVNFEIPADIALGDYTLTVSAEGQPDQTSEFSIVRNAPGLFPAAAGQTSAMIVHEDGTPVTADAPAKEGELLTLYGTGIGPADHTRPEATPVPASPRFRILDPVTLQVGSAIFKPEAVFAAPGHIGVDAVQFRLDSSAPAGPAVPVYLTVNGVQSNTLAFAIQ